MTRKRRLKVLDEKLRAPAPERRVPALVPMRLQRLVAEIVDREAAGEGLVDIFRSLVPPAEPPPAAAPPPEGGGPPALPPPAEAPPPADEAPAAPQSGPDEEILRAAAVAPYEELLRAAEAAREADRQKAATELRTALYARIDTRRRWAIALAITGTVLAGLGVWGGMALRSSADERLLLAYRLEVEKARRERDRAQDVLLETLDRAESLAASPRAAGR